MNPIDRDILGTPSRWLLRLDVRKFALFQIWVVTSLVILGFLTFLLAHVLDINTSDYRSIENFLVIFDVGKEQSIPTWFSIINLLLSSLLLFCHFIQNKNSGNSNRNYWLLLSVLFLFLSIDEAASLHNLPGSLSWYITNRPDLFPQFMPEFFRAIGVGQELLSTHPWVPYGLLFVVLVGIAFIPFLFSIPLRLSLLLVLSGGIFVSGSVGLEVVAAWMEQTSYAPRGTFVRNLAVLTEEAMEMYAIVLFNTVLFAELATRQFAFQLILGRNSQLPQSHQGSPISRNA